MAWGFVRWDSKASSPFPSHKHSQCQENWCSLHRNDITLKNSQAIIPPCKEIASPFRAQSSNHKSKIVGYVPLIAQKAIQLESSEEGNGLDICGLTGKASVMSVCSYRAAQWSQASDFSERGVIYYPQNHQTSPCRRPRVLSRRGKHKRRSNTYECLLSSSRCVKGREEVPSGVLCRLRKILPSSVLINEVGFTRNIPLGWGPASKTVSTQMRPYINHCY